MKTHFPTTVPAETYAAPPRRHPQRPLSITRRCKICGKNFRVVAGNSLYCRRKRCEAKRQRRKVEQARENKQRRVRRLREYQETLAAMRDAAFPRTAPTEPTMCRPGSPGKIAVMAERAAKGMELWCEGDAEMDAETVGGEG